MVPITVLSSSPQTRQDPSEVHPRYSGAVFFQNTFDGKLPATDYPKVNVGSIHISVVLCVPLSKQFQFYFAMFIVYAVVAAAWGWLCFSNLQDLLPIQVYLSSSHPSTGCSLRVFVVLFV